MSIDFKYFPDIFADLIERVKPRLVGLDVVFEYGTFLELMNRCQLRDNNQIQKYPLVWLEWDKENNQQVWIEPCMYKITPRFYICSLTDLDSTTQERYDNTLKPVLYPIFDLIMDEINYYANMILESNFTYSVTDHPFWLKEELPLDKLSAIEVKLDNITLIQI